MSHRRRPFAAAAAVVFAAALTLTACVTGEEPVEEGDAATETVEATSTIGRPHEQFKVEEVPPLVTKEIKGERVQDPAMELSYKWQGSSYAPGGGSVVVVAVTNESDAALPVDVLKPELRYNAGGGTMQTATPLDGETAGVDIIGLDYPLGPGATVNCKYAFDVSTGNLWDAAFTIGNVTFEGNLNN